MSRAGTVASLVLLAGAAAACGDRAAVAHLASGYVEATEIRVSADVAGRVVTVHATEGQRVSAGDTLVTLSTTDTDLGLDRLRAEREQARAELRLLRAGARPEDIRQAEAQVAAAVAEREAAVAELSAAREDEARFEALLARRAGSAKQRDDATTRRRVVEARVAAAGDRHRAAEAVLEKLRAGARTEEVAAASARVAAVDARLAALEQDRARAVVAAPVDGVVSARLIEPGELAAPRVPLLVLVDLDRAWASVYVEEPAVPALRLDQPATVLTDAGDRLPGRLTFISPRAEFTPRNVQTADERAKLVYRVKVSVDNRAGLLKPGMPVQVDFGGGAR